MRITFKTPDAVYYALRDFEIDDDTKADWEEFLAQYIKHGEYISIDFDIQARTASVIKLR